MGGGNSDHECEVYDMLELLVDDLSDKTFGELLKDELAEKGYINVDELFPEI